MSLHFEGSPESDSKMDFSETPTTDSAGVSPLAEEESQQVQQSPRTLHQSELNRSDDEHVESREIVRTTATITGTLDNRIKKPEISLESSLPQRQIIAARTLANSHPLMSPTNSHDSDSEQCQQVKCKNFPDVVPRTEHILQHAEIPLPPQTTPLNVVQVRNTLNSQIILKRAKPQDAKLGMLRASSPDLLSSESDADVSQYLAAVESNFQSVALIQNTGVNVTGNSKMSSNGVGRRSKRLGIGKVAGCEDISSLDSISNHSFDEDEDIEHNLASLSPSSSLIDGLDGEDDDDDCEGPELLPDNDDDLDDFGLAATPTPNNTTVVQTGDGGILPQYTAAEERRDSRNWQKITLPDGRTREIDMRVIEPYKRVLSHGGYLKAGGQNAIVIFCACHLPDRSRADYSYVMDNLFLYVVKTLEQLVTDDYVLIYLHGGSSRRNVPPFPWLKRCYQLLDRRLRKSLKYMYLVHPTFWIKSLVWMARPFVSTKFWRKLIYVKSLEELGSHVAVEKAAIPEKVKQYDAKRH